jgi:hypothetical protein
MAWTTPKTWVANQVLTAAELNEQLRDNMAACMPSLAREDGEMFFTEHEGKIAARKVTSSIVNKPESTASTSYTNLATVGPTVTMETGPAAWVFFRAFLDNDSDNAQSCMSFEVTGASSITASDSFAIIIDGIDTGNAVMLGTAALVDLTPGVNTFTAKYRAGGAGTMTANRRFLTVLPL